MKTKIALYTLLALGGTMAQAQEAATPPAKSGYVGALLGMSKLRADCDGLEPCDLSDTSAKLFIGERLSGNLYAEASFIRFGKIEYGPYSSSANALTGSLAYRYTVDRVTLAGRVGLAYTRAKTKGLSTGEETSTSFRPIVGVGVEFAVMPNLNAVLAADFTKIKAYEGDEREHAKSVHTVGAGVSWSY